MGEVRWYRVGCGGVLTLLLPSIEYDRDSACWTLATRLTQTLANLNWRHVAMRRCCREFPMPGRIAGLSLKGVRDDWMLNRLLLLIQSIR